MATAEKLADEAGTINSILAKQCIVAPRHTIIAAPDADHAQCKYCKSWWFKDSNGYWQLCG